MQQLAKGTLPKACFQHYLKQDYIYLFHYSRAFALGVFKARNFAEMEMPRKTLDILCQEIKLHLDYCRQWEISEQEIFQTPESAACISYTRYLLDCGMTGGLPELYAAVTPCALGYAQVARYITENYPKLPSNPYQAWIDAYSTPEYQQAAQETVDFLTALCETLELKAIQVLADAVSLLSETERLLNKAHQEKFNTLLKPINWQPFLSDL